MSRAKNKKELEIIPFNISDADKNKHISVTNYNTPQFSPELSALIAEIDWDWLADEYFNPKGMLDSRGNQQVVLGYCSEENLDGSDDTRKKHYGAAVPRLTEGTEHQLESCQEKINAHFLIASKLMKLEGIPHAQDDYKDEFYEECCSRFIGKLPAGLENKTACLAIMFNILQTIDGELHQISETVEHGDLNNCETYSHTCQVNRIMVAKGHVVRATLMSFPRDSVTRAVRRIRAIRETVEVYEKPYILAQPPHRRPGPLKPELIWDDFGKKGLEIAINRFDGSIGHAALCAPPHPNKFSMYESTILNGVKMVMEAKPETRNRYFPMEVSSQVGMMNNHLMFGFVCAELASKRAALNPDKYWSWQKHIFESMVNLSGGFTSGPCSRSTTSKNDALEQSRQRDSIQQIKKMNKDSKDYQDVRDQDRVAAVYLKNLEELDRIKNGAGAFGLSSTIHVNSALGINKNPALVNIAVPSTSTSGNATKDDSKKQKDKPNPYLREYLNLDKKQIPDQIRKLLRGIYFAIVNDPQIPLEVRQSITYQEIENIYCEARRNPAKRAVDFVLPGGLPWYEFIMDEHGNCSFHAHHPFLTKEGNVVFRSENLGQSVFNNYNEQKEPDNLMWKSTLTAKEKARMQSIKGISMSIDKEKEAQQYLFVHFTQVCVFFYIFF